MYLSIYIHGCLCEECAGDGADLYPFSGRELVRALYLQPARAFEYMKHVYIEDVWMKLSGE
jgi:hypothetical protein